MRKYSIPTRFRQAFTGFLFVLVCYVLLTVFTLLTSKAEDTRPALNIEGSWALEVAVSEPSKGVAWRVADRGLIKGGGFAQFRAYAASAVKDCIARLDGSGVCQRLKILIEKPVDKTASFAIQFPGRTQRIVSPKGQKMAVISLDEISLDDFGLASMQLNVEGAAKANYGILHINTHEDDSLPAAKPTAMFKNTQVDDGAFIKAGWFFLFFGTAKKITLYAMPSDLLSFCGFYPGSSVSCSSSSEISVRIRKKGDYTFIAWSKDLKFSTITIRGV